MKIKALSIAAGMLLCLSSSVSAETTIEPTVLVDQDGIKITATKLTCDGRTGELKLKMENNRDEDITIVSGSIGFDRNAINGYMPANFYINTDLAAGKKAKETVDFGSWTRDYIAYEDVASIVLSFQIQNEDYDEILISEPVEIRTTAYDNYDFNEDVVSKGLQDVGLMDSLGAEVVEYREGEFFSLDGITLNKIAKVFSKNNDQSFSIMEFENTTDSMLGIRLSGYDINGISIYSGNYESTLIPPHTKYIMEFSSDYLMEDYYGNVISENPEQEVIQLTTIDTNYNEMNSQNVVISGVDEDYAVVLDGIELYNADGIQMISKGIVDTDDNSTFIALVKNDKEYPIYVEADSDFSVNGYMIDTTSYMTKVDACSVGLISFEFDKSSLEECDITNFDNVEGAVSVIDDNWNDVAYIEINTSL